MSNDRDRTSDAHDLKWAVDRLYMMEADACAEDTATSRNDAKALIMVLEEIDQDAHEEPCCPFCGCDPFHRVDNGVGMEAVAVTCCELGDLYFRGARAAPEEVTLSWEEFTEIGRKLSGRPPNDGKSAGPEASAERSVATPNPHASKVE